MGVTALRVQVLITYLSKTMYIGSERAELIPEI